MAQVGRVLRVVPLDQLRCQARQFAKLLFRRVEILEVQDITNGYPWYSDLNQIVLAGLEDGLR